MIDKLIGDGLVELRALPSRHVLLTRPYSQGFRDFVRTHAREDVYFGVAPRDGARVVQPARCLWADIDFKDAPEAAARAELALFEPAPSYIVRSGNGLHCYWLLEEPLGGEELRRRLLWLASQLGADRRSAEPARILRVPGTHNHKYNPSRRVEIEEQDDLKIYGAWEFGEEHAAVKEDRARVGEASDAALARARAFIDDRAPAIEGQGGDNWTYETACVLARDYGLGDDQAMALLAGWNERCQPPWTREELREKLRRARRYGQNAEGSRDPAADFAEVAEVAEVAPPVAEKPETLMDKMNRWFRCVDDGGKLRIMERRQDDILGRKYWIRYARKDFIETCKSVRHLPMVAVGEKADGSPRYAEAAVAWLDEYRKKDTYTGVVFAPEEDGEKTRDGRLNLWRGFAVAEREGRWGMLKALIYETLCHEDAASYEYVLDWMARAVQRPWEPGQVALVFKGPKGSGKSTLGRALVRLFGQHGMAVASQTLLTGRFNAHLRDCAMLFADEAFWAGDKAGESTLKSLLTEPVIAYEGKGRDVESGRNCVHVVMASNADWVVPAGLERERRFAVFGVADDDRPRRWWDALYGELEDGGHAAMLWELRRRDVSGFDVFRVPQTEALAEQRGFSMMPVEQWLLWAAENDWDGIKMRDGMVLAEDLYDSFRLWCRLRDVRGYETRALETVVGAALRRLLPTAAKRRAYVAEEKRQRYFVALPDAAVASDLLTRRLARG